jgi:hypothetical protein
MTPLIHRIRPTWLGRSGWLQSPAKPDQAGRAGSELGCLPEKVKQQPLRYESAMPFRVLLFLGLGVLLAGCSTARVNLQCPNAAVLTETATLTGFRPGAPADPSGEAYTARMTGVTTNCTFSKASGRTISSLVITVQATRAPSPDGATYTLPYYVAATQGDRLLSKKNFTLRISFPPGSATASVQDTIDETVIQLEKGHAPTDYQLLVGFQLTRAQRDYNAFKNRFTP